MRRSVQNVLKNYISNFELTKSKNDHRRKDKAHARTQSIMILDEISLLDDNYSASITKSERLLHDYPVAPNHVPIVQILQRDNVKEFFHVASLISTIGGRDPARQAYSYPKIKSMFANLNFGDIARFRPEDSEDFFNKHPLSYFLTQNFICILRENQCACARCGILIDCPMFGAIGFESDHVEENYRVNEDSERALSLDSHVSCIETALSEASKTQLTCGFCHYRNKYCIMSDFPKELMRKYDPTSPQAVSLFLDSTEGKNLLNDFERAWQMPGNSKEMSFKALQKMVNKVGIALEDVAYFSKSKWGQPTMERRKYHLCRVYQNIITRKTGGCLLCGLSFSSLTVIQLYGVDFHHVLESKKECDPTKCAWKSPKFTSMELRKTCALCKKCHSMVTYSNSAKARFTKKFTELGYSVNDVTGNIVCGNAGDV